MIRSLILPLKCSYKLQIAIKGKTLLLKVTVSASPSVAHEHGHIRYPLGEAWAASRAGGEGCDLFLIFIISTGNADFLVQGSVPKVTAGTSKLDSDLQLGKFWHKTGMKQQNFQDSHLSQLLFGWDWKALLTFYFLFSVLINCPLGHQELDKAERFWLISYWAGEERWRQSFLSKAPVVLSPEELKKPLGTFSRTSDSSLSCSKMFTKTYTPWRHSEKKAFF